METLHENTAPVEITMDEDTWIATFHPMPNLRLASAAAATWVIDYEFDTHNAEDIEFLKTLDPQKVWTIVEADNGRDEVILSGIHWVNRRAYLATDMPSDAAKAYAIPFFVNGEFEAE